MTRPGVGQFQQLHPESAAASGRGSRRPFGGLCHLQRHFSQRDAGHALRSVSGPGGRLPSIQGKEAAKLQNVMSFTVFFSILST